MEYLVVQITIPTNDEPFDDDNDDNDYLVEIMVIYMVLINKLYHICIWYVCLFIPCICNNNNNCNQLQLTHIEDNNSNNSNTTTSTYNNNNSSS